MSDAPKPALKPVFLALGTLDAGATSAVQEVEQRDTEHGRQVRVRMHSKLEALGLLAKVRKLLVERAPEGPTGNTYNTLVLGRLSGLELQALRALRAKMDGAAVEPEDLAALSAVAVSGNGGARAPAPPRPARRHARPRRAAP